MVPKRALNPENAKRRLIEAEDSQNSVYSEQFKRDLSKVFKADDMIKRCANKGTFYKYPEWSWREQAWTYFIEGSWWRITFTVTNEGTVVLKTIRDSKNTDLGRGAPQPDSKCPYSSEKAIELLQIAQGVSKVAYTDHCRQRLIERGVSEEDIRTTIAVGVPYKKPEWDPISRCWTFSMEAAGLRLFFSVDCVEAVLITIYAPDPNYRKKRPPDPRNSP
jgi:hypothetical protein